MTVSGANSGVRGEEGDECRITCQDDHHCAGHGVRPRACPVLNCMLCMQSYYFLLRGIGRRGWGGGGTTSKTVTRRQRQKFFFVNNGATSGTPLFFTDLRGRGEGHGMGCGWR